MPSFTFERLSPPARPSEAAPAEKKPRSRLVQLLDRFSEARTKRALNKDRTSGADDQKPSE
jgi:hypothetical protein